jgi:hypothetical protein
MCKFSKENFCNFHIFWYIGTCQVSIRKAITASSIGLGKKFGVCLLYIGHLVHFYAFNEYISILNCKCMKKISNVGLENHIGVSESMFMSYTIKEKEFQT